MVMGTTRDRGIEGVIEFYFEFLAEKMMMKGLTPQVWARQCFGEQQLMLDPVDFVRGIETLLAPSPPPSFFGDDFTAVQVRREASSSSSLSLSPSSVLNKL